MITINFELIKLEIAIVKKTLEIANLTDEYLLRGRLFEH